MNHLISTKQKQTVRDSFDLVTVILTWSKDYRVK
jgi:hypothetical protein